LDVGCYPDHRASQRIENNSAFLRGLCVSALNALRVTYPSFAGKTPHPTYCVPCSLSPAFPFDGEDHSGLIVPVIAAKPRPAPATWKNRRWTFDELVAELPESNLPTELWDGELLMSPAPSFLHQEIVARFYKTLDSWVIEHHLGKTGIAPLDMVLTPRHATQPDVVFISNERLGIIKERLMGAADLVAEVHSPGSRRRDRIDKRDLYEQHGVREYWLIDPEARTVEVLALAAGTYQLVGRWHPGERARSRLLKGFEVPVSSLFGEAQAR
jgi:Uma2 family endonuclease